MSFIKYSTVKLNPQTSHDYDERTGVYSNLKYKNIRIYLVSIHKL